MIRFSLLISILIIISLMACDSKEGRRNDHFLKANTLLEKHEYPKAIQEYDIALAFDPEYSDAYNNRGIAFFETGNYKEAIISYDSAIQKNPNLVNAYYNRSKALMQVREYAASLNDLQVVERHFPDTSALFFALGLNHYYLRNFSTAIENFEKAMRLDPVNPEIFVNLASV